MDERLRFVARRLEGEKMAPLCAEFGISRKTGYKIFERDKNSGVQAFTDRSRRPYRQANRLPPPVEAMIVRLKRDYPGVGGAEDPREAATADDGAAAARHQHGPCRARPPWPGETPPPASPRPTGTVLSRPTQPNALWCADYKGEFLLGNRRMLPANHHRFCQPVSLDLRSPLPRRALGLHRFERAFQEFGLPRRFGPTTACPLRRPTRSTA